MNTSRKPFIPELWSEALIKQYKVTLADVLTKPRRSKGEKLLRAAAQGASQEEIDKIDREEDNYDPLLYELVRDIYAREAAGKLAADIDARLLADLGNQ